MTGELVINYPEASGLAVLHSSTPSERCNTDDAKGRSRIDPATADALLTMGEARRCEHCYPQED